MLQLQKSTKRSPLGLKSKVSRTKCCMPHMPTGQNIQLLSLDHDNLLLVTGGAAEDESPVLCITDVRIRFQHY